MNPLITVLLPVYNGAEYIRDAINSILQQTFIDFELLIINDGSKDATAKVIAEFDDPRIIVIHQENIGLAATLNKGIALARGHYIARQDHDDISLPERLRLQLNYMLAHPECVLLGTHADVWVDGSYSGRQLIHPTQHAVLVFEVLFDNPFVHSSMMFKRDVIQEIGGYTTDKSRQPPEDFELWSRLARTYNIANLAEILLIYREVPNSISRTGINPFQDKAVMFCVENLSLLPGMERLGQQHVNDVAALTHFAFDRLSKKASIRKMRAVVLHAGDVIADKYQDPQIKVLARERNKILLQRYLKNKIKKSFLWQVFKKIKNFILPLRDYILDLKNLNIR